MKFLSLLEIKDYNVKVDGHNLFDQQVKYGLITYYNIRKIATGQIDDYRTGCLLGYHYFEEKYNLITMDVSTVRKDLHNQ